MTDRGVPKRPFPENNSPTTGATEKLRCKLRALTHENARSCLVFRVFDLSRCCITEKLHNSLNNKAFVLLRRPLNWVQGLDLNQRPSGYEPDELPGCSTLRLGKGLNIHAHVLKARELLGEMTLCHGYMLDADGDCVRRLL